MSRRAAISAEMLGEALWLGRAPDDELLEVPRGLVTMSRWESGRRVSCFSRDHGHVFDVLYNRRGEIERLEPGSDLTLDVLAILREQAESAFAVDAGFTVWREVLFAMPEVLGHWTYRDEWQILPAPPQAPRPDFVMGEHPFILEHRVRASTNPSLTLARRFKQWWRLHLLLSLLLRGSITREWLEKPHRWMVLPEPEAGSSHSVAYLNEGYAVGGGFIFKTDRFSDPSEFSKLTVLPDDEYFARRGTGADDSMDVPACLDEFFDRFNAADPDTQEQLLRASYWRHAAYRVWHTSKSLSFIAAINAIEALFPRDRLGHMCPICERHHDDPGPTARFREFLEKHAASESEGARSDMYNLRSNFVHGGELHGIDLPRSMSGGLVPAVEEHRDLHDTALAVSRTAIRTWFFAST